MSQTVTFIIARMKHATPAEVVYRIRQAVLRYCAGRLARRKGNVTGNSPSRGSAQIAGLTLPEFSGELDNSELLRIVKGKVFCHNARWEQIQQYERKVYSTKSSGIRVSSCPLDMRTVWEPARLQHLTCLFAAPGLTGDEGDNSAQRAFARNDILSWLRGNPFLNGPHYMSAMECALRIPVFVYSLKLLDNLTAAESDEIATAIHKHAWWIERNLSLYSSRGNHTVSEALGLIFAGALFRKTPSGDAWLERGSALLLQELNHQILKDGGPAEQSFSYHRFVLDLYWLAIDFLERNKLRSCDDFRAVAQAGETFLAAMEHGPGCVPAVGDSDDGHAVAPGLSPKREAGAAALPGITSFKESGYTVIRGTDGVVLTFDHGPLGMAPLYNHGHADALSIILSQNGEPLLVDPGTYRYNGEPELRAYFRSTRAHNTVTIDGQDQALQETGFIWRQPYRTGIVRNTRLLGLPLIEALHDGYARLTDQVRHKRLIVQVDGRHFIIRDSFWGEGRHRFELNFHLHPEATVQHDGEWWCVKKNEAQLFLKLPGSSVMAVCGQEKPPLGWFSDGYGSRRGSMVLQSSKSGYPDEITFISVLCVASLLPQSTQERIVCAIENLA